MFKRQLIRICIFMILNICLNIAASDIILNPIIDRAIQENNLAIQYIKVGYYYGESRGLLKYDLTPLSAPSGYTTVVTSVRVKANWVSAGDDTFECGLFGTTNTWDNDTNWSNKPPIGKLLASWIWPGNYSQLNDTGSRDLAAYIQTAANSDMTVSFYVAANPYISGNCQTYYTSTQSNPIKLFIKYYFVKNSDGIEVEINPIIDRAIQENNLAIQYIKVGHYYGETRGLFKYDMTSIASAGHITTVTSAEIDGSTSAGVNTFDCDIFETTDDWDAYTTWANKPTMGTTALVSWSWPGNYLPLNVPSTMELVDYIQKEANGDKVASFYITANPYISGNCQTYYTSTQSKPIKLIVNHIKVQKPLFFDWYIRVTPYDPENFSLGFYFNERADVITPIAFPGFVFSTVTYSDFYEKFFSDMYDLNLPISIMLINSTGPVHGTSPETLSNVLDMVNTIDLIQADFEPNGTTITQDMVDENICEMVAQVREHSNPAVNNAWVGNYDDYPGSTDATGWPGNEDRTSRNALYMNSGLNIASPVCYTRESYSIHANSNIWGSNVCPNTRSALFWAALEKMSIAKRNLPEGHLLLPWISGFISYNFNDSSHNLYHCDLPPKEDTHAIPMHIRLRGANGYNTYTYACLVSGRDVVDDYYNTQHYIDDEAWRVDMLAAWQSLDDVFNESGALNILNLATDKTSGVQWSGVLKGDKYRILVSNLTTNTQIVTFAYPQSLTAEDLLVLPTTSGSIPAGSHVMLTNMP